MNKLFVLLEVKKNPYSCKVTKVTDYKNPKSDFYQDVKDYENSCLEKNVWDKVVFFKVEAETSIEVEELLNEYIKDNEVSDEHGDEVIFDLNHVNYTDWDELEGKQVTNIVDNLK